MLPAEAAALVGKLAALWPRPEMSEATSLAYEEALMDLDSQVAAAALRRLTATSKFLPSVAEIRAAAADVLHGPVRPGMSAWGDVLAAVEKVGFRQQAEPGGWTPANAPLIRPKFEDPLVSRCVDEMGGWGAFRNVDSFDRSGFVKLYEKLAAEFRVAAVSNKGLALPDAEVILRLTSSMTSGKV